MENLLAQSNILLNALTRISRITSTNQIEEISLSAKNITECLPLLTTPEKLIGTDKDCVTWENFIKNYYSKILCNLILKFDNSFPIGNEGINKHILNLFIVEHHLFFGESLSILVSSLKNTSELQINSIIVLLEHLLKSNGLIEYLVKSCIPTNNDELDEITEMKLTNTIQILVSIPSRSANRFTNKTPQFYSINNIYNLLVLNLIRTIITLTEASKENITYNVKPLSEYFGKILTHLSNSSDNEDLNIVVKIFELLCQNDVTKHIINDIFYNLSNRCIERVLTLFLKHTTLNNSICTILNNVYNLQEWQYILLTKIPLLSNIDHNNITFIYNLVLYVLSNETDNYKMATDFFTNLLKTWSNKSAITHTSIEQQLYITKILIITAKLLDERKVTYAPLIKQELTQILIKGVPNHIESPNVNVRIIGMVTSEFIMSVLKECEGVELKFDYNSFSKDSINLAEDLRNFGKTLEFNLTNIYNLEELCYSWYLKCNFSTVQKLYETSPVSYQSNGSKLNSRSSLANDGPKNIVVSQSTSKNNLITIIDSDNFELDSDDDLEPYDLSNDQKYSKKDAPSYLRDLLNNLIDMSDPDIFTSSLNNAEKLIVTQLPNDDISLAIELLEVFTTLEKKFFFENFDNIVFNCSVNITSIFPTECAEFLCKKFHSDIGTYTITQRISMLDILSQTSRVLSQVNKNTQNKNEPLDDVKLAEQTIKSRLEKKTRRFFSNHVVPNNENKFAKVAGSFFFPLVHGFKSFSTFALTPRYDTDNILLVHFLKTISILMYSAQNCAIARHMAKEILNISFTLRFHKESKVRLAVLHMIGAVVLNTPKFVLKGELLNEILEARLWLGGVLGCSVENSETNTECKLIAANVLCLVENALKVESNEVLY